MLHPHAVSRLFRVELLRDEKLAELRLSTELEASPVDHRVATKDEADGLQVGQGELVQWPEPLGRVAMDFVYGRQGAAI
jgi:hypothetical protein